MSSLPRIIALGAVLASINGATVDSPSLAGPLPPLSVFFSLSEAIVYCE